MQFAKHLFFIRLAFLLCASCGLGIGEVGAQEQALYRPQCNPNGNGPQINACARQDLLAADRALNASYKRLYKKLPAAQRAKLVKEQRAWPKTRDSHCKETLKGDEGFTIWPSEFDSCLAQATRERIQKLHVWSTPSYHVK